MKISKDILMFALSIVVSIVSLVVLIFFFRTIDNKNKHTSAVMTTLAEKVSQKDNMQVLIEKINKFSEMDETINSYFVNSKEVDLFLNYIEGLGQETGVTLKVNNFEISPTQKNLLSVKVSTKGSFSNTMRTLLLIENAPYKVNVTRTFIEQQSEFFNPDPKDLQKQTTSSFWKSEISFNVLISS